MGFYDRHILPRFIDLACSLSVITEQRRKVVPHASGTVLEIGIGSGLNLAHYDAGKVDRIIGVDPDDNMWKRSAKRRQSCTIPIERIGLSGEQIPLDDATADTVLVTYSLCTIPDPVAALSEMRRIMRPGGQLLFLEHGEAPDENIRRWQARIDPTWKKIAGGCHSGRPIPRFLTEAGWAIEQLEQAYLPGIKPLGYNYWGSARGA